MNNIKNNGNNPRFFRELKGGDVFICVVNGEPEWCYKFAKIIEESGTGKAFNAALLFTGESIFIPDHIAVTYYNKTLEVN